MRTRRFGTIGVVGGLLAMAACGRSGEIEVNRGVFTDSRIVDAAADVGLHADLELKFPGGGGNQTGTPSASDQANVPAIAYYDVTNGDLKFAELLPNGQWEIEVVDDRGDVGSFADLDFDSFNNPHIAYYDVSNQALKYAFNNGFEWVRRTLDVPTGVIEGHITLQLDQNDVSHMAVIGAGRFNLEYLIYDSEADVLGGAVVDNGVILTGRGGNINQRTALRLREIGGEQLPVIGYYQASFGILTISWMQRTPSGSLSFIQPEVVDGTGADNDPDIGQFADMVLEDDRIAHFSYYDATNQDVKYARFDMEQNLAESEVVDSEGIVGQTSSIALFPPFRPNSSDPAESAVRPAISYFDGTNNDLKLALRAANAQRWQRFRVDLSGVVGTFSSMKLLPDENLGIAYRSTTQQALKFTTVRAN